MNTTDEEPHTPVAVKALASKFERLGLDTSAATLNKPHVTSGHHSVHSSISGQQFLSAEPSSPRPRALSNSHVEPANPPSPLIRQHSSSSDLKNATKRPPPPPPPSRGLKPSAQPRSSSPSPMASPLLRPVPAPGPSTSGYASDASITSQASFSLKRKPPPPPPPSQPPLIDLNQEEATQPPAGSVANLRNRFS